MSNRNWREHKSKAERKQHIYKRDKGKCQIATICGGVDLTIEEATLDHIIPYSHGGPTTDDNLQLACRACNEKKANEYECSCGLPPREQGCRKGVEKGWQRYADNLELRMMYAEWRAGLLLKDPPRKHWKLNLDKLEEFRVSSQNHEVESGKSRGRAKRR